MSGSSYRDSSPERGWAAAVIVAAGSGRRMGGMRKQYLELCGEPVLLRAIRPFLAHPAIRSVVVVLPSDDAETPPAWLAELPVTLAPGGAERGDSVWSGLERVPDDVRTVLIHDGARPFVTASLIDRVLQQATSRGALAALPATDTIKEVDEDGGVVATLPRARIWQAQTPQGFPLESLRRAYRRAREEGWAETDDAAVYERFGLAVAVVEGDRANIKITRPEDVAIAEAIARAAAKANPASGKR